MLVNPNLRPQSWDVDLQMDDSILQFSKKKVNDVFNVRIFINAQGGNILSFGLYVWFHHEYLKVISCEKSGIWSEATLESNLDGTNGEIFMAAIGGTKGGDVSESNRTKNSLNYFDLCKINYRNLS